MTKKSFSGQENVDQLIEVISQLEFYALGEGPAACQVCDRKLREGDELTAYAFRAAGNPSFEIGYVMCGADEHAHPTEFMRGVDELIITGRIGLCTDVATQSSWLVLIAPEPIVASRPKSSDAHTIGEVTTRDLNAGYHEKGSCVDDESGSPMDCETQWWRQVDSQLGRIRSWSAASQFVEGYTCAEGSA